MTDHTFVHDPLVHDHTSFRKLFSHNFGVLLSRRGCKETGYGRVKEVAQLFNMSTTSAQKWLTGAALPEMSKLPEICRLLHCSLNELFYGITTNPLEFSSAIDDPSLDTIRIFSNSAPRSGYVSKGFFASSWWEPGIYVLEADDETMEPFVVAGEYVLFEPISDAEHFSGVYVVVNNGRFAVRRLQESMQHTVLILCENKRYAPEQISADLVRVAKPQAVLVGDSTISVIGRVTGRVLRR